MTFGKTISAAVAPLVASSREDGPIGAWRLRTLAKRPSTRDNVRIGVAPTERHWHVAFERRPFVARGGLSVEDRGKAP
jgi:hypothetical protein